MSAASSDRSRKYGVRTVSAWRVDGGGEGLTGEECQVVEEDMLSVEVEGVGDYLLMWTPTESTAAAMGYTQKDGVMAESDNPEALALAAGFCLAEGIVDGVGDIQSIAMCTDRVGVVRVQLADPSRVRTQRRNVVVASSCGVCGGRERNGGVPEVPAVGDSLRLRGEQLGQLMAGLRKRQAVFHHTGGAHAAAIFAGDGSIIASAEDLGRHNALDKVIGICLLRRQRIEGCGVLLSSRLSYEMIVKAARAKLELVAAVSAPTSLAIEFADRAGITLCGFVREDRATIYTHSQRVAAT